MAIGMGLGREAAVFGALLHMTYHSLAKPVAFFSAGTLAQLHSSSNFDRIGQRDVHARAGRERSVRARRGDHHRLAAFGLFFSEMMILRAGFFGLAPDGNGRASSPR